MSDLLSEVLQETEISNLNNEGSQQTLQDLITVYQQEQYSKSIVDLQKAFLSENVQIENIQKLQFQIQQAKLKNKELYDKINRIKSNVDDHYENQTIKKKVIQKNGKDNQSIKQNKQISETAKFINRKPNLLIPQIFERLFGKDFDEYEQSIHNKISNIQNLTQKQIFEKSKYLMHELVMQEMHFKKLYKLFYFFNKEEKKVESKNKKFNYPTGKIKSNNNLVKTYERKIYQHLEGFCNRGIQMDKEKHQILKDAFKKDKSQQKKNKKLTPNLTQEKSQKRNNKTLQKNLMQNNLPKQNLKETKKKAKKQKIKSDLNNTVDQDGKRHQEIQEEVQENINKPKKHQIEIVQQNNQEFDKNLKNRILSSNKQIQQQENNDTKEEDNHQQESQKKLKNSNEDSLNINESNMTLEYLTQHQEEIKEILKNLNKKCEQKLNGSKQQNDTKEELKSEKFLQQNYLLINKFINQLQDNQFKKLNKTTKESLTNDFNFSLRDTVNFLQTYNSLKLQESNKEINIQQSQDNNKINIEEQKMISDKDIDKRESNSELADIKEQIIQDIENLQNNNYQSINEQDNKGSQNEIEQFESQQKDQQQSNKEIEQSWAQIFLSYSNHDQNVQDKIFQTEQNSLQTSQQQQALQDSNQSQQDNNQQKDIPQSQMILLESRQSYEYSGQQHETKINSLQSVQSNLNESQVDQIEDIEQQNLNSEQEINQFKKKKSIDYDDNFLNLTNSDQYANLTFQSKINSLDQQQLQKLEEQKFDHQIDDQQLDSLKHLQQTDQQLEDKNELVDNSVNNKENQNSIKNFDNIQTDESKKQQENEIDKIIKDSQDLKQDDKEQQQNQHIDNQQDTNEVTKTQDEKQEEDLDYFNMQNTLDEQLSELFYDQLKQPLQMTHSINDNLHKNFKPENEKDSNFSTFNPNIGLQDSQQQLYATPFQRGQSFGRKEEPNIESIVQNKKESLVKKIDKQNLQYSISKDRFIQDDDSDLYKQQQSVFQKFQNSIRNQPIPISKQEIESLKEFQDLNDFQKKSLREQLKLSEAKEDDFDMIKIDKDKILISESLSNSQSTAQKKLAARMSKQKQKDDKLKYYDTQSFNENEYNKQDTIDENELQNQSKLKDLDKSNDNLQHNTQTQLNSLASIQSQTILHNNLQSEVDILNSENQFKQNNQLYTESNENHKILYDDFQTKKNSMDQIIEQNDLDDRSSQYTIEQKIERETLAINEKRELIIRCTFYKFINANKIQFSC